MRWSAEFHDAFEPEFQNVPEAVQDELLAQVAKLREFGPTLGRPTVDTLAGSRITNLKEMGSMRGMVCGEWHSHLTGVASRSCWWQGTSEAATRGGSTRG